MKGVMKNNCASQQWITVHYGSESAGLLQENTQFLNQRQRAATATTK
jgi:hypothetical protein